MTYAKTIVWILLIAFVAWLEAVSLKDILLSQENVDRINNDPKSTWKARVPVEFFELSEDQLARLVDTNVDLDSLHQKVLEDERKAREAASRYKRQTTRVIPRSFDARFMWPYCRQIGRLLFRGTCSATGAISAVGAASDRTCIHSQGHLTPQLSVQDVLECCDDCGECTGGEAMNAWGHWVNSGLPSGGDFGSEEGCKPYMIDPVSVTQVPDVCPTQCSENYTKATYAEEKSKYKGRTNYTVVDPNPVPNPTAVESMQTEIMSNGPITVRFLIHNDFFSYEQGVYIRSVNAVPAGRAHAKLIGWGEVGELKYWLGVNSLRTTWGYQGVFKYLRGVNQNGIESLGVSAALPRPYTVDEERLERRFPTDLVFVIDASLLNVRFIAAIANFLQYPVADPRDSFVFAFVVYTDTAVIRLDINPQTSREDIFARLENILQGVTSSQTPYRLDRGLDTAADMLVARGRTSAAWVILAIVGPQAGQDSDAITVSAANARKAGVLISVVGLYAVDYRLLSKIASRDLSHFAGSDEIPNEPRHRLFYDLPIFYLTLFEGIRYCYKRLTDNGLHLHQAYGTCDQFYACRKANDDAPFLKQCPHGTLWDQRILNCNWPRQVYCRADPCRRDHTRRSYGVQGNCRLYWGCELNRTYSLQCCPQGRSYNAASQSCVRNSSCTDTCRRQAACQHALYLDFADGKIEDTSYHFNKVAYNGVTLIEDINAEGGWLTAFTGYTHLTVPFFANNYLGRNFQMYVKFCPQSMTDIPTSLREIIITNGDIDGLEPTLFLGYNRFSDEVDLEMKADGTVKFAISVLRNQCIDICLKYDGTRVFLTTTDVDGRKFTRFRRSTGPIKISRNAIHIGGRSGSAHIYTGFVGTIDKVWISRCLLDTCE